MRERAAPWFRTPVVTHALMARASEGFPLVSDDGHTAICGAQGFIARGVPRCPDCAMAIEYAINAGVGAYDEKGAFLFESRAFPSLPVEAYSGGLRMATPHGMVEIVADPACDDHWIVIHSRGRRVETGTLGQPVSHAMIDEILETTARWYPPERVHVSPRNWATLNSPAAAMRSYDGIGSRDALPRRRTPKTLPPYGHWS